MMADSLGSTLWTVREDSEIDVFPKERPLDVCGEGLLPCDVILIYQFFAVDNVVAGCHENLK